MSAAFDWNLWRPFFITLALGTTLVFLAVLMMQRWICSMAWRRTLWQIAFLSLGLLAMIEISGASRMAWGWVQQQAETPTDETVLVESRVIGEPDIRMLLATQPPGVSPAAVTQDGHSPKQASTWWPGVIWLAGFGVAMAWMTTLRLFFLVFVPRRIVKDEMILSRVDAIARRLGMSERVRVTEARGLAGPIAFGVFRASISLPEGFARRFSGDQQDVMLAHELAHLAARDPLWHALADVVMAVLWWHPLAWLAKRELRSATEAAADEASLVVENGPAALAECLVELAGRLTRTRSLGWLGMEGGDFRSGLGKRVKRLVSLNRQPWNPPASFRVWLVRMVVPLVLVALVLASTVWAQPMMGRPGTLREAFQRSVLGIALTAAMPAVPNEPVKPKPAVSANTNAETPAPAPIPSPISTVPSTELHTRMFRIDPSTFRRSLANVRSLPFRHTNAAAQIVGKALRTNSPVAAASSGPNQMLKDAGDLFNTAGVDFSLPGKQLLFVERSETLIVRATLQDLDIVEQAVQLLNMPTPQLTIEVKVFEIETNDAKALGLDWILGGEFTNIVNGLAAEKTNFQATGVLTDPQSRVYFRAMEQRGMTNLLGAPRMTTLSGRPGQFKHVNVRYIVTDLDWSLQSTNVLPGTKDSVQAHPIAEPFELGPVLDVVPYVLPDGYTIQMTLIPTFTEFLGYDLENGNRQVTVTMADGRKEIITVPNQPCPIFRKRQMVSNAIVWDGQTVVMAGGSEQFFSIPTRNEPLRKGTKIPTDRKPKHLLIFVTPTLIDPAGNRIHKPEEIPPWIPPQQQTPPGR